MEKEFCILQSKTMHLIILTGHFLTNLQDQLWSVKVSMTLKKLDSQLKEQTMSLAYMQILELREKVKQ